MKLLPTVYLIPILHKRSLAGDKETKVEGHATNCPRCHSVLAFAILLPMAPGSAHLVPLGVGLGEP